MTTAAALTRELAEIRALLAGRSAPQLAFASIEDGSLSEYDAAGVIGSRLGQQFDGTHMAASLTGPVPPTPSAPILIPSLFGLNIGWDGTFTNAFNAPMDWSRIEVHMGDTPGFDAYGADTLVGTIETPRGATVFIPTEDYTAHYVKFFTRTLSGMISPVSAEVSGTALKLTGADSDVDFSLLGSVLITFATSAPGSPAVDDVWVDTDSVPANKVYQWSGSAWVDITALPIANAIKAAATAQTTADGKIKTFVAGSAPTATGVGDLWIDSSNGNKVNRWDGSAWQPYAFGDLAISSLSATKITAGVISSNITISGRFATALTGARVEMNSVGFQGFDSGGNQTINLVGSGGTNFVTGLFATALTGARIELGPIAAGAAINEARFWSGATAENTAIRAPVIRGGSTNHPGSVTSPFMSLFSGMHNSPGSHGGLIYLYGDWSDGTVDSFVEVRPELWLTDFTGVKGSGTLHAGNVITSFLRPAILQRVSAAGADVDNFAENILGTSIVNANNQTTKSTMCTITAPFTGHALFVGVADCSVTVAGASSVVIELQIGASVQSSQCLRTMSTTGRWTSSQSWVVPVTEGDVILLTFRQTGSAGTASVFTPHTKLSGIFF